VFMDWIKKAPTAVVVTMIIVCGFVAVSVFASYVILTLQGADTAEFRQWINTLGQIMVFPLLGVSTVAAVSAAKSASKAEEQTNGHLTRVTDENIALRDQLTERDK
jgi:hypothetical protein